MKYLVLVLVIAFAFSTTAMAVDIAISTQANWWSQEAADREMQEIVDNVTTVSVERFAADQQDALADWVVAHTGDGASDLLILCGQFPETIYEPGNTQVDDSIAELFLDDGNTIVNTGDYLFYVVNGAGTNGEGGIQTMMDIPGISMWDDDTAVVVTADGQNYTPSLVDFASDRPFHLDELEGDWYAELVLAQNEAGTRADAVIVANAATGGRLGIFYQTASQDDDPRGEVISEWINNWYLLATAERTVLFAEDFEGLALGPNVDEELAGDTVWTDTPPEGWAVDESGIPGIGLDATDGITEWAGWAFADKAWWTEAAGDQDRSLFELGSGTVAVADPDEWDDGERLPIPISADPYDTWLITPEIKIGSAEAGTLELKFDSSWRPEFDDNWHQTANITASFDGGEPVVVMLWESDEASANYKPYATNETVIVKLDKPEEAKKVVLTFGLFDAGNDWWWAIDNVEVRGVVLSQDPVDPGTDGLAAYYAFENDVNDSSGNENNGTIVGDPVFAEGPTGYGMAMEFDGIDDYVDCGNAESLDITGDITVACWIKVAAFSKTWETILGKGDHAYRMSRGPGTGDSIHFGANGTGDNLNATTIVTTDTWRHVALVYDGTDKIIYIDGVEDARAAASGNIESHDEHNLFIGQNSEQANRFLTGLVDEVAIYNRALSGAEIRYLAGERATPVDPGNNGLVAFYAFENDATDSSGNELHGTLVGDAKFAEGPAGYGMALDLDGDGDYVDCGAPSQLDITEQIAFTYWIKAVALDKGWNTVLSRGDDSWRSSRAGTENFMEAAVGGTSGNYLFGKTLVDDDKWHHVGAVYDGDTFSLYVDGNLDGSEESTGSITVSSYPLYIGNNSQNTDREWTGLIDEVTIYDRDLSVGEIRYLAGKRAMDDLLGPDVTGLGDVVKGVPDEPRDGSVAGWPDGEYPWLAVDDDVSTKYLHFKGEVEPTGFVVEPASGESIVTGLTFTTANDATERDPISFELSGSNESIDGPYELIASGDIVDFAQDEPWPRFTMNATPITFSNNVAYKYYQVMFPAVRDPGSANSMQIAEVELRASKF